MKNIFIGCLGVLSFLTRIEGMEIKKLQNKDLLSPLSKKCVTADMPVSQPNDNSEGQCSTASDSSKSDSPQSKESGTEQISEEKTIESVVTFFNEGKKFNFENVTKDFEKKKEDETFLFYLNSLLSLAKVECPFAEQVVDELANFDSYYKGDPYYKSLIWIYKTGIHEYAKLFTEEGFKNIQLVLEFSKVVGSSDFYDIWSSVEIITDMVMNADDDLSQKFKSLLTNELTCNENK